MLTLGGRRDPIALYDLDGNGKISMDELRQVMRGLGATEADAARTMAAADTDGDGLIDFDEARANAMSHAYTADLHC